MSQRPVYVAGTRSFAAEVVDFALEAGLRVVGLLEPLDPTRVGMTIHDLPVRALEDADDEGAEAAAIVGTGDRDRRPIVERLERAGWRMRGLVHPRAHVARSAAVAPSAVVGPGVVVGARAEIGPHVVVGRGALVGHHARVEAFATVGPGANVAGNTRVGSDAFLGISAAVRDHLSVGRGAVVAMGAVVVADVPAGVEVVGVPARPREPRRASAKARGAVLPGSDDDRVGEHQRSADRA